MTQELDLASRLAGVPDTQLLRRAFGMFATGVTVVTAGAVEPHGMTANSFTSLSLSPPLVLLCVGRNALMHSRMQSSGCFGISVLAADQQPVAQHFADRRRAGPGQFDDITWKPGPVTGVPLIDQSIAEFECEVWRVYDGGDHSIVTGQLLSLSCAADDSALLFFRGQFHQLQTERTEVGL